MRGLIITTVRKCLIHCERGATAVEYGLILALIFLAVVAAVSDVALKTVSTWDNVATQVLAH